MVRFRILLAGMPRMLQDIVEERLRAQPDMQIVGTLDASGATASALSSTLDEHGADIVILGLHDETIARSYEPLLFDHCRLRLLAIVGNGRDAFIYELKPNRTPIPEVSAEELLDVIRATTVEMR